MRHLVRASAGAVLGGLLLAGCGSNGGSNGGGSASPSSSTSGATASTSSSAPTSSAPSSSRATTTPPAVAECRVGDLRFRLTPGEGAAGSTYYTLRMTNTSTSPCLTGGYGGVSLVAKPGGQPIGAPADRVQARRRTRFTLPPNASAEATLREANAENYPRARCHPTPAHGLKVYPPDETHSVFVRHAATACSSARVRLLQLAPYAKVR